jgi:hypothetical protein
MSDTFSGSFPPARICTSLAIDSSRLSEQDQSAGRLERVLDVCQDVIELHMPVDVFDIEVE